MLDKVKKTSRQLQAEQTKEKIFQVAIELLSKTEFENIRIQDIVQNAGVSVGAFYNYYQTKIEVYYEAYEIANTYFESNVRRKLKQKSSIEKLKYYFKEYFFYNSTVTYFKLTKILYNSSNNHFNRDHTYGMLGILTDILRDGIKKGELVTETTAEELADFFLIAARGLVYNWCTLDGDYDLDKAAEGYINKLILCCKA